MALRRLTSVVGLLVLATACGGTHAVYRQQLPSPDGIGKVYLGREIAQVMGHRGIGWLEREGRLQEERPDLLLDNLPLAPGSVVADLGAGSGYLTIPIAERVPAGRVLAVDVQPEMLDVIRRRATAEGLDNIVPILGEVDDPMLPEAAVDLALLVDAYHEFSHPREMMEGVVRALRPGGVVALVEYRAGDPSVRIKPLHTMTVDQARREMTAVGLELQTVLDVLPQQHLMLFRRAAADAGADPTER